MSVKTVKNTLKETLLRVADLPLVKSGEIKSPIPSNAMTFPGTYIEQDREDFDYAYLGMASHGDATDSMLLMSVLVVIGERDVPTTPNEEVLEDWISELALRIRHQIEIDSQAGLYKDDGDQGFAASVFNVRYHLDPDDNYAAALLTVRVKGYV
jgi:hypothetical protein